MTQEEKLLVKKELSVRAFYGVKAHYQYYDFVGGSERLVYEKDGVVKSVDISLRNPVYIDGIHAEVEHTKPYLRSMSKMTVDEANEMFMMLFPDYKILSTEVVDDRVRYYSIDTTTENGSWKVFFFGRIYSLPQLHWLLEHHFDFNGLIEKGLALEATEDVYKTE